MTVSAKALASGLEPMAHTGSIAGISDAANRGLDACFCQTPGAADGNALPATVAVVDQTALLNRPARIKYLFRRGQNEVSFR